MGKSVMATRFVGEYGAPPRERSAGGDVRRVGMEVELGHLTLEETLALVQRSVGGDMTSDGRMEGTVDGTPYGSVKVEVDSSVLKDRRYLRPFEALGFDTESAAAQVLEDSVMLVAREFVPIEVVTPPLPWDRLHELDPLWTALRSAGAEDTRSSVWHAFGLHLNVEPPDLEVGTLLDVLRSYLLLEDWIMRTGEVDLSRLVAPYVRAFPEVYRRKILDPDYQPDWAAFVDDYLEHSPTRNRPLDLLPLIGHIGAPDLAQRVEDWPLTKPRPAFHYRLPNCELARPGWSPAGAWNRWIAVECLADDGLLLRELSLAYLATYDLPLRMQRGGWIERLRAELNLAELEGPAPSADLEVG